MCAYVTVVILLQSAVMKVPTLHKSSFSDMWSPV